MNHKWTAKWTGTYPNLCCGSWRLYCDGRDVSEPIPFQGEPAETYGDYCAWAFTENWDENWSWYNDGLKCNEWIEQFKDYLFDVTEDESQWPLIYQAFQEKDWRHGECGGCI